MSTFRAWLYGLGFGAGLMYLYDPGQGNRRRSMLRDQTIHTLNSTDDLIGKGSRDLSNRASGVIAGIRARVSNEPVSDEVLAERIRSKIGGVVSHPHALQVTAQDGHVTLRGPVLAVDAQPLLARVASVRGVTGFDNQLEVHEEPGDVPALQGEAARTYRDRMNNTWSPGIRLAAILAGGMLALSGLRGRGLLGTIRSLFGLGLLARGVSNQSFSQLIGTGNQPGAAFVHQGIRVGAPVHQVFEFWQNYDNFPRFMAHVLEVRDLGEGRSHWKVTGPAGTTVEWDAVVTNLVPDQLLAWESLPGSAVAQTGMVRFASTGGDSTQISVQMSYTPPAGAIGQAVASFFGSNPRQALHEDLMRFKSLIEQGKTTARGQEVSRPGGQQTGRATTQSTSGQKTGGGQPTQSSAPKGGSAGTTRRPSDEKTTERRSPASQADRTPARPGVGASFSAPGEQPGQPGGRPGMPERESGIPGGGGGRTDEVGPTGVYPASDPNAPEDAQAHGMASWGQGERGAAGYEDHGDSELSGLGEETDFGSVIPDQPDKPKED